MTRLLPRKRSPEKNLIIWATFDYFGTGLLKKEIPEVRKIALYLMNYRKGIKLSEEQKSDMLAIKANLKDKVYVENLCADPPKVP